MRKLAAGNWKMNGLKADGVDLAKGLAMRAAQEKLGCDLLVCPPVTLLVLIADALKNSSIELGAQNCHAKAKGAHTGEVSAPMLKDAGCTYVILGHSERRNEQGESDATVRAKVAAAQSAGLAVILCVGETLVERDAGHALDMVAHQLEGSLPIGLAPTQLVIAYEPVWAIGTGRTPTPEQIAEVHAHIRYRLEGLASAPKETRILYGGSVRPDNAKGLMGIANVDGALVGGASLVAADFWAIARACA